MDGYEYRVCWRREHDKRHRTRIYQTLTGATDFARFLDRRSWDEIDTLEDWAVEHLRELGDPIDVRIERRTVGGWE